MGMFWEVKFGKDFLVGLGRWLELDYIWKGLSSWTFIGRWLELRGVRVCHSESIAMWEEAIVR